MTSYYDLILGLIPLALFGIGGTLSLLGLQLAVAIPVAASVAVGLIGHALFVNQPNTSTPQPVTDAVPTANGANQSPSMSTE